MKYKLCRIEVKTESKVQPIDEQGEPYMDTLATFESGDDYYYAIYENIGDEELEEWAEYDYHGDDFKRALAEYKQLTRGE